MLPQGAGADHILPQGLTMKRTHTTHVTTILTILVLVASVSTHLGAEEEASSSVPEGKLYHYRDDGDTRSEIEVHFPENHDPSKPVPGVILFHGGAWKRGDKADFRPLCAYLASRGMVAATAHYTLAPNWKKEGAIAKRVCITSAKSAIRWFKHNAPELGIDPERVVVGGSSAGGHIALLATMNEGLNDPKDPTGVTTTPVAYVLFNPAVKAKIHESDNEVFFEAQLKDKLAPAIVMFGTNDSWRGHFLRSYKVANEKGLMDIEFWTAPDQPHGIVKNEPWGSLSYILVDKFLAKQGLISGEPTIDVETNGEAWILEESP